MALIAVASLDTRPISWLSLALAVWAAAELLGALCLVDRLLPLKPRKRSRAGQQAVQMRVGA